MPMDINALEKAAQAFSRQIVDNLVDRNLATEAKDLSVIVVIGRTNGMEREIVSAGNRPPDEAIAMVRRVLSGWISGRGRRVQPASAADIDTLGKLRG